MKFTELDVWKVGHQLTLQIYRLTEKFDKEEKYALTQQMRRAAYSVPMNIAEGKESGSIKIYMKHLYIARGSNAELQYQLILSRDLGYITESEHGEMNDLSVRVEMMLNKLITRLRPSDNY